MKKIFQVVAALYLAFSGALSANAVVMTYQQGINGYNGTQDTYIWEITPDANRNGEAVLHTTRAGSANPTERATLVRFDNLGIPAGASINSVTLKLYQIPDFLEDGNIGDPGVQMDVAGLLVPFGDQGIGNVSDTSPAQYAGVEGGPTVNHRLRPDVQDTNTYVAWNAPLARAAGPDYSLGSYDSTFDRGPVDTSVTGITAVAGYFDFDVTTSFSSQFANDKMYGWILHGDIIGSSATDGRPVFRDWEFAGGSFAPQLVVDYTVVPEPTTFALVALGLAGMGFTRRR